MNSYRKSGPQAARKECTAGFSGVAFDHCLPCPINTYHGGQFGCLFCPDGSASYSYAATDTLGNCEPCAEEAEICAFSRWTVDAMMLDSPVIYDFSENALAAFRAFQDLLTNPMIPMVKPGFWGRPVFGLDEPHERWQKSPKPSGRRKLLSRSEAAGALAHLDVASFEEFELLSNASVANYSAFQGFRIFECVDEETCRGTYSVNV